MSLHNPLFFQGVTPEQAEAAFPEIQTGKEKWVEAITERGGTADVTDSYDTLKQSTLDLVTPSISLTPLISDYYPAEFHDLFSVMAANYDDTKPYMYSLLLNRYTTSAILALFVDGSARIFGGETDADKTTRWVIFKSASQAGFSAVYNSTYSRYIYGVAVFNADIKGVSFNGSTPLFLIYNDSYTVDNNVYPVSQFQSTYINNLVIPATNNLTFANNQSFYATRILNLIINTNNSTLTISGLQMFAGGTNMQSVSFSDSILTLNLTGSSAFQNNTSLVSVKFPANLQNLAIGATVFFGTNIAFLKLPETLIILNLGIQPLPISIVEFIVPDSVQQLTIGSYLFANSTFIIYVYLANPSVSFSMNNNIFSGCTGLVKIGIGTNWNYALDLRSATALTRDNIMTYIAARLKDNVGQTAKTITFSTRYNTGGADPLTTEQKAVFTGKNWTLAYA